MSRISKAFALALVLVLLTTLSLGVIFDQTVKAQYQGDITINADGTISPSSAPINYSNNIYILTRDLNGSISVNKNNTIVDGYSHTVEGGFSLSYVSNVTIRNLIITNTAIGISLTNASDVTVTNNVITNTSVEIGDMFTFGKNTAAIEIFGGGSNIIRGNNLVNNLNGIQFYDTSYNLIFENNLTSNLPWNSGVVFSALTFNGASNNTFYRNNFIGYQNWVLDMDYGSISASVNVWDDGYPAGGNYWSDYLTNYPNTIEIDHSGIGDTIYYVKPWGYHVGGGNAAAVNYWQNANTFYAQNKDRYPLMKPFTFAPPTLSLLSPINQVYNESSVSFAFTIGEASNWTGYSLDGKQNVTVAGNTTLTGLSNGLHRVTVYANDSFGNMGASQTVNFTVVKPTVFPFKTAIAISVVILAVLVSFLFYRRHRKTSNLNKAAN